MVGIDTDKCIDCELCKEKRSIVKVTLKKVVYLATANR